VALGDLDPLGDLASFGEAAVFLGALEEAGFLAGAFPDVPEDAGFDSSPAFFLGSRTA
jgi:hypothetical protein